MGRPEIFKEQAPAASQVRLAPPLTPLTSPEIRAAAGSVNTQQPTIDASSNNAIGGQAESQRRAASRSWCPYTQLPPRTVTGGSRLSTHSAATTHSLWLPQVASAGQEQAVALQLRAACPSTNVQPLASHPTATLPLLTVKPRLHSAAAGVHCTSRLPGSSRPPTRVSAGRPQAKALSVDSGPKASCFEHVAAASLVAAAQAASDWHSAQLGPANPSGQVCVTAAGAGRGARSGVSRWGRWPGLQPLQGTSAAHRFVREPGSSVRAARARLAPAAGRRPSSA